MGDWWAPLILRDIFLGLDRFEDLAVDLGISRNLLATRLNDLVTNGLLDREPYSQHPPRDRYVLTPAGEELVPILAALTAWGDRWETPPGGPPVRFRHDRHRCTPQVACSTCGEPLSAATLVVRPGPGGRAAPGTQLVGDRAFGGHRR
ncbi:MAG: putative transcriptional regulator [Actinomycetia bacterium]|nr:putative transcriptional regulator [Actinomycetes bacterium]